MKAPGTPHYSSAILCYGRPDVVFATKLAGDLKARGVSCWFFGTDKKAGKRTQEQITSRRREAERVIPILSIESLLQAGLLSELDDQIREDPDKLIPVSLDAVWRRDGARIMWGTHDLKPFLMERNYVDFSVEAKYEEALDELLRALERDGAEEAPPAANPHDQPPQARASDRRTLERRVAAIASLLNLRGVAKDHRFAPQILDNLASVLILKYLPFPPVGLDEPLVHMKLLTYLRNIDSLQTDALKLTDDLRDQGWDNRRLQRSLEEADDVMRRRDKSQRAIGLLDKELTQLYTLVEALIAEEIDEKAAEAKVQIALAPQESDRIEYKSSLRYDLREKRVNKDLEFAVIKAISGLANHLGGTLYIGVNDQGEILGLEPDLSTFTGPNKEDDFRRHFDQLVTNNFGLANYQIVQPEWVQLEWAEPTGRKVFVVKISAASAPMFVKNGEDGDFYVRRGARTIELRARRFLEYYDARWSATTAARASQRPHRPGGPRRREWRRPPAKT